MTNFKKAALSLAVASTFGLTACGGGSSGSVDQAVSSDTSASQTVTAIDGYLTNAELYIDANQNGALEASEKGLGPIGKTDENGRVQVKAATFDGGLLVSAVAGQTLDSDSGVVTTDFVLSAPSGSNYITPFTHLMKVTGESAADLATDLGVDQALITGDFIKAQQGGGSAETVKQAKIAHAVARFIVAEAKKNTDAGIITSSLIAAKEAIEAKVDAGEDPALVEVELGEGGAIVEAPTTKLVFSDGELKNTVWSMYRLDDSGDNEQFYLRMGTANEPGSYCLVNERFSFLDEGPNISIPGEACETQGEFRVANDGELVLEFNGAEDTFTMLYRHEAEGIKSFVMVKENGELFWLDSRGDLEDPDDYVIDADSVRYVFLDDDGRENFIDYMLGQRRFEVESTTIKFGDIDTPTNELWETSYAITLLSDVINQSEASSLKLLEEQKSDQNDLHYHVAYRTAGELELVLDIKPDNGNSENLYLQSGNKALIEQIAKAVTDRNSGNQGDD